MSERPTSTAVHPPARVELETYAADIQLTTLPIGIDNIHFDVWLSPRFVDFAQKYVLDLVKQHANLARIFGADAKKIRPPETGAFKKLLADLLQAGLTRAKYEKNIEIDILLRLAVLKLLTQEVPAQFNNALLECKDWVRSRGEYFERSEKAHVVKAQLAEIQGDRRNIVRRVGEQLFQVLTEMEDAVLSKSRKALFGNEFTETYEWMKNRLLFVEGRRDDFVCLEQYVLLGNFQRDLDRFDNLDTLFFEFLRDSVSAGERGDEVHAAAKAYDDMAAKALDLRTEVFRLEEERQRLVESLAGGESLIAKVFGRTDPAELRARLSDVEKRHTHLQQKLDSMAAGLETAKGKAEFLNEEYYSKLGQFLNQPENARRLFDPNWSGGSSSETAGLRAQLLDEFIDRLEQRGILLHILASYELRNVYLDYCPPVHLQQLKRALVQREELKVVEDVLKQFPARQFSLRRIEDLAGRVRRYPREQVRAVIVRFAEDFMRLRRDLQNAERLSALMDRVNLIRAEKTRELSRMNNSLNEYLSPDEARPAEDRVVSHAVIKADVRGSTRITHDLLARGLNPASHFSLNFYEPVKRILDQYGAFKVFVEGDAIILAINEHESNRASQRAVAKACLLAREMLAVAQGYNARAQATQLPRLEIGIGIAFQDSPPTYWVDGESRIMISRALNLSDRLSSCAKVARRLLAEHTSPFNVFVFQTVMEGTTEEEVQEFLIRYNMNGIELNEVGFKKLSEEIALAETEVDCPMPWGRERCKIFMGEVPIGEKLNPIVIRRGLVRQLLSGGKVGDPGTHEYYEVCLGARVTQLLETALAPSRKT
jgi:class 3 adenylate cyclase